MKIFQKIILVFFLVTLGEAWAATSTSELLIKVYQVAVSASTDCSGPQVIFTSTSGTEVDFLKNPMLGGGNIPDGTYPCIMINMSDVIKYRPTANDGTLCVAGTQYFSDVCRSDSSESTDLFNGSTTTNVACTGINPPTAASVGANQVTLYLFTTSPSTGAAFRSGAANGFLLGNPFVVSGSSTGTFVVDVTNKVMDNGSYCEMDAPTFSFR